MVDKLFQMYMELLTHKKLTAAFLAQKLEVSTRTIYRYVDALSLSNVPIRADKGTNGGIMLCEESKLYANTLTKQEFNTVITALDNLENTGGKLDTVDRIKQKIASLEKLSKNDSFSLANRNIVVENSYHANSKKIESKIRALDKAIDKTFIVKIKYHDRSGIVTERDIEPYSFVVKDGEWYIYAWCLLRNEQRLFKLTRITHIMTDERTFVKRNVSKDWKLFYDTSADTVDIVIKVNEESRYDVEEWLGIEAFSQNRNKDIATGSVKADKTLYSKLLSFGNGIEVISPDSVRNTLKETVIMLNVKYNN
ncbi:MAG: YafY family transcriptional regulator [Clostridia bacterium]|jgi:predicted DNA-binding transcriptional regulator YafY|nr:YafY family transcriptional regulator [Clostridia bacterium]